MRQSFMALVLTSVIAVSSSLAQTPSAPETAPTKAGTVGQTVNQTVNQTELDRKVLVLAAELRCLVCQNQSIADSAAPLAVDLRGQIREQLTAGKSDNEIYAYMVARYGNFVLYRPPVQSSTWLLWFGPFGLLLLGAFVSWRIVRKSAAIKLTSDSEQQGKKSQQSLDELLK